MSQSMKALQAMLTEGISLTEASARFGVSKAAVSKAKLHPSKKRMAAQTIEQLQARVAELEAENARLKERAEVAEKFADSENESMTKQLLLAQAEIKRLRDSLKVADGYIAMRCGTPDPNDPYADKVLIGIQAEISKAIKESEVK